jgi:predicted enzyme related to lactoylglutathione lyase
MFEGLRTVIYRVKNNDLDKAKNWYSKIFGKAPYFDEPFYVGFNIGGFELGLDPSEEKLVLGNNIHAYWGVPDIEKALKHCLKHEAKVDSGIRDVGGNIKVATVCDPFGNILGLIENLGFKIE